MNPTKHKELTDKSYELLETLIDVLRQKLLGEIADGCGGSAADCQAAIALLKYLAIDLTVTSGEGANLSDLSEDEILPFLDR